MTREEFTKIDVAFKAVREFGFPTVMLTLLLAGLWVIGGKVHDSVIVPLVSTHTEFMKATRETQARQADALETLSQSKDAAVGLLQSISESQDQIKDDIRAIRNQPSIGAPRKAP